MSTSNPFAHGSTLGGKRVALWNVSHHTSDESLASPLRMKKSRHVIIDGDLFHEDVSDHWITQVFVVMMVANHHTYQVLTKRSDRMRSWMTAANRSGEIAAAIRANVIRHGGGCPAFEDATGILAKLSWPPENVWLGISAERQTEADARIPDLLATPAAVRFVSAEPLIGPIDFFQDGNGPLANGHPTREQIDGENGIQFIRYGCSRIDWIIVGGESGHGARPMHSVWARSIRDQCVAAGVPFFLKQIMENGKKVPFGDWPEDLKIREIPHANS